MWVQAGLGGAEPGARHLQVPHLWPWAGLILSVSLSFLCQMGLIAVLP